MLLSSVITTGGESNVSSFEGSRWRGGSSTVGRGLVVWGVGLGGGLAVWGVEKVPCRGLWTGEDTQVSVSYVALCGWEVNSGLDGVDGRVVGKLPVENKGEAVDGHSLGSSGDALELRCYSPDILTDSSPIVQVWLN
jgi:hypothetical protein